MTQHMTSKMAPELEVQDWLNTKTPMSLSDLRGKVVVIEAFQMLCPGCVSHSLPQAMNIAQTFSPEDVAVIGLHTVFEHHSAQGTREALTAFLHEYRITFPVAIDAPSKGTNTPKTMTKYQMRGTPSLLLIDRQGYLRKHAFGRIEDMALGAEIMALTQEVPSELLQSSKPKTDMTRCDDTGCALPS